MLLGEKLIAFRDSAGPGRHHGPSLPAPLRLAVLRPQRGRRPALRLSRLEVRRRGQLRRHAEPAAGTRTSSTRSRPRPTRWSSATASSGSTWAGARRRRRCRQIEATLLPESEVTIVVRAARMQLAAGARRRHRHLAFRLSACRRRRAGRRAGGQPVPLHRDQPRARTIMSPTPMRARCTPPIARPTPGRTYYRFAHFMLPVLDPDAARHIRPNTCTAAPGCRWTTPTRCSSA